MTGNPFLDAAGIGAAPTAAAVAAPVAAQTYQQMLGAENHPRADGSYATSPKGAVGPAQVMPATGPEAAAAAGVPWDPQSYAHNPGYNSQIGEAYYAKLLTKFNGDPTAAAAAYNAGPGRVANAGAPQTPGDWRSHLPAETVAYIQKVAPGLTGGAPANQGGGDPTAAGGGSNPFLDALGDNQTPQTPTPADTGFTSVKNADGTTDFIDAQGNHAGGIDANGRLVVDINGDNPAPKPAQPAATDTSQLLGAFQGATRSLDNAATWADAGLKKVGVNLDAVAPYLGLPTTAEANQSHKDYIASKEAEGVTPGKIGDALGSIGAAVPLALAVKNPWLVGAAAGALDTEHPDDAGQVAKDAALGAVSGKVGDVLASGVSRVVSPNVSAMAKMLADRGVPLTPGQIAGGTAKRLEDASTSIPVFGDIVRNAQRRSSEGFANAAVQDTLDPIGQTLPSGTKPGYEAVDYAHRALSNAYEEILPKLTVQADQPFVQGLSTIMQDAKALPPSRATQVQNIVKDSVMSQFSPQGSMTGHTFKAVDSKLGQIAGSYGKSLDPEQRMMSHSFRDIQSELRDLVARSNPHLAPRINAINSGYAKLVRVEGAASSVGAKGGAFTPAQLASAIKRYDNSARKSATARGAALMQGLAEAGQHVLPSSVPDSGTPLRSAVGAGIGLGATAKAGLLGLSALKAAPLAIPLGAYTKTGGKLVAGAILKRPASAKAIGEALAKLKTPAAVGASQLAVSKAEGR